jgi:hypothetical protein
MNNQQKQIVVLVIAGIVLAGVIGVQMYRMSAPGAPPAAPRPATPASATAAGPASASLAMDLEENAPLNPEALEALLAGIKQVTFNYPVNPGRDPMIPLLRDTIGPGLGEFTPLGQYVLSDPRNKVVSAIIGSGGQRYAVVDEDVVFPGYVYPDGVRVEAIHPKYVTFNFDDKRVDVPLKE